LSDRLKHLDRLEDLAMLLRRKRVFQHAALQKLEACPYSSGTGIFALKFANFSILLNRYHLGRYKPRITRISLISRVNPVFCLPRRSPASAGRRRTLSKIHNFQGLLYSLSLCFPPARLLVTPQSRHHGTKADLRCCPISALRFPVCVLRFLSFLLPTL
jgi:hypothetical protein